MNNFGYVEAAAFYVFVPPPPFILNEDFRSVTLLRYETAIFS